MLVKLHVIKYYAVLSAFHESTRTGRRARRN